MSGVLVVRPSSLGDVVHALALVSDVEQHCPELAVDWVAEEAYAPLLRLDPRIRRIVPLALRRWRQQPLARATRREFAAFRTDLRRDAYVAILDLQEQIKGAVVARMARGLRHGFDRASIREPAASLLDNVHHRVPRELHFLDRCRRLAGAALGYDIQGPPRWHIDASAATVALTAGPYVIAFHATSRAEKLWPEERWRHLLAHLASAGFAALLPSGNEEEAARSRRIAQGSETAVVLPAQTLPELASLIQHAQLALGVDTGLTHLAAALGTPTVSFFTVTDPARAGVRRMGAHARDLGGKGDVPTSANAIDVASELVRLSPRR
ncbi:MAG: lipopolysaccharide heptosyltransferase I [Casimicrobiaceae bacterium]